MAGQEQTAIEGLEELVQKQRRLIAGQLRIVREERELREQIDRKLEAAGVDQVECAGYIVRRTVREGKQFATVTKVGP